MPQITLEQTSNLNTRWQPTLFLKTVHEIIAQHIDANISQCKSRIVTRDDFFVGDGSQTQAFVNLTVNILSGRAERAKIDLATHLLQQLNQQLKALIPGEKIAVSCYVGDLVRECYVKN